jgi:signal peptide peptidase SppA
MMDAFEWWAWAIRPEYMESLLNDPSFESKLQSAIDNPEAMAAVAGRTDGEKGYDVIDGVAVISIAGPMAKRMSFMLWLMGGITFGQISDAIYQAVDDPGVDAIVLNMDSPGGTVSGTDAFAETVATAAAIKPVVSFANGCMCSATYWSGSAASMVMAERTASVGSIGVVYVHKDVSKAAESAGIKFTVLTAGKYKATGNNYAPLPDADREVLQGELDAIYNIFISSVADHRGVDEETVKKNMADGRVFIGAAALDAGLVDGIGNLDAAIEAAREMAARVDDGTLSLPIPNGAMPPKKEQSMDPNKKNMIAAPTTVAELTAALPDLAKALRDEGAQTVDITALAKAEGERLLGLVAVHFGAEACEKFSQVVATGVTEAQYKAIVGDSAPGKPVAAGVKDKDQILAALENSGADNPGADNGGEGKGGDKDFMSLVEEHMAVFKVTKSQAIEAQMKKNPKAHEAYLNRMNSSAVN